MSQLKISDETSLAQTNIVFIVKEDCKVLNVFSSLDGAKSFILRKIGEYKDAFLTSSWCLDVQNENDYSYKIKCHRWIFNLFYYETVVKIFEIEDHPIIET
jgi:hypothetical protein